MSVERDTMETMNAHNHLSAIRAKELGFWIYLMSDAVLFALLFTTYLTMKGSYEGGLAEHGFFDLGNAFVETLLLLLSTLSCGLAMSAARCNARSQVNGWLIATALLGACFLTIEIQEFLNLIRAGAGPSRNGFLSAFFTLVGTHGFHVSLGLIWLLVMIAQVLWKGLTVPVYSRLFRFSLFWHFLDLIWVGIFTVVYLAGVL
jgi:cytochrome o ubiquinol oxidase subunit III